MCVCLLCWRGMKIPVTERGKQLPPVSTNSSSGGGRHPWEKPTAGSFTVPPLPPPASYIKAGPTVRLHHRHRPAVDSNTTLLFSLAKWKKKLNNKNGEGNRKHPQISVSVIVRPGRQSSQADDRRRASGDPDVPEQTPPTGAQHAQEPQSLQGGSHQQRHRLHLRPPDGLARSAPPESIKQQQQRRRRQQLRPAHHHGHVAGRLPDLLNPQKTVIATTSGRTITCDNYLKNRRPLYIILLSLHTYYLPTCLSRNTKKKHGKFLPVSYHHTNKHSSFLFSNGLDAFCVSSLASGVARVFLMAHTHTVIIKIALTMGRDGDRRIWCRCSMMKKKSARELYEHKWFTRYKKTDVLRVLPRWPWEINVDEEFSSFSKKNTRSWRHETGHPSSPLIFSFQCCPGVFLFLSGRVSLCVWRNVNIWPRLFTHPWDEEVGFVDLPSICTQRINWASSAIYYAALLVGRRRRKKGSQPLRP